MQLHHPAKPDAPPSSILPRASCARLSKDETVCPMYQTRSLVIALTIAEEAVFSESEAEEDKVN